MIARNRGRRSGAPVCVPGSCGREPRRVLGSVGGAWHLHGQDALRVVREHLGQPRPLVGAAGARQNDVDLADSIAP